MMTRGRSQLLALLSLTATVASCKVAGSGGDIVRPRFSVAGIAAADYFPLDSGWKWAYSVWENGVPIQRASLRRCSLLTSARSWSTSRLPTERNS